MSRRLSSQSDTGAALVLVLGLISVMSTAAVFSFDSLSRLIQNNLIEQQRAQARHYALAAEQISIKQLRLIITEKQNFGFITRSNLNRYDYTLEKATLNVVATDISNCFNVNALVSGSNIKGYVAAPGAMRQFAALLQKFGIGETAAMGLSSALADWQDTDNVALPLGAESTITQTMTSPIARPMHRFEALRNCGSYAISPPSFWTRLARLFVPVASKTIIV